MNREESKTLHEIIDPLINTAKAHGRDYSISVHMNEVLKIACSCGEFSYLSQATWLLRPIHQYLECHLAWARHLDLDHKIRRLLE